MAAEAVVAGKMRPASRKPKPPRTQPARAGQAKADEPGKDGPGSTKRAPAAQNCSPAPPDEQPTARHRRKKHSKRLGNRAGWDLVGLARDAAMDFVTSMLAYQRIALARKPAISGAPKPMGIDAMMDWRLRYVRTVGQFRAAFTPAELAELASSLEASLNRTARGIVDGIGAPLHAREQYLRACGLTTQFAGACQLPCPAEDLERRLDEREKETGEPALISDLGPCEPLYPSKKKLRIAVARGLGVDESTVRRLEKSEDPGFEERITKSSTEQLAEKIAKSRQK